MKVAFELHPGKAARRMRKAQVFRAELKRRNASGNGVARSVAASVDKFVKV